MIYFTIIIVIVLILSYCYAPFPRWRTYWLLWKNVLFNYAENIPAKTRLRQALLLVRYVVLCPLYTCLWYLDEVLYPSYKKQVINPVFIIGSPRSGTTFLHRTLASDEETFFALRHIEWRFPFIIVQKFIKFFHLEQRIAKMNYWPKSEAGVKAAKMHANTLYDWEEDGVFFEERFLHHFYILLRFPYRGLKDLDNFTLLPEKDQCRMMGAHRRAIQKVMYVRARNKIYLSKEGAGHTKLRLITEMYPHVKFIVNIRPSFEYVSSILELIRLSTLVKTNADILQMDGFKEMYIKRMSDDSAHLLNFLNDKYNYQIVLVAFNQLVNNVKDAVGSIYKQLKLPITKTYEDYLLDLQGKQKSREKNYEYSQEQFAGFEIFDNLVTKVKACGGVCVLQEIRLDKL